MPYETPQFDDSASEPEPLLPPESDMPSVELTIGEITYRLTWRDTLVRRFLVGGGEFDHFLHEVTKEDTIYVFFNSMGEDSGQVLSKLFEDNNFPTQTNPILDEVTIEWYSTIAGKNLEDFSPLDSG